MAVLFAVEESGRAREADACQHVGVYFVFDLDVADGVVVVFVLRLHW